MCGWVELCGDGVCCVQGKTVRGWIDLTSERDNLVKKSIKYFDEVIQRYSTQCVM